MVNDMTNYLDFGSIFINEVIGDPMLAYIILMIILVVALIKLGFNEKIIFIVLVLANIVWVIFSPDLVVKVISAVVIIVMIAVNGLKALRGG